MDAFTFLSVLQDGIVGGATYTLLAIGVVLIFNVTRIGFVPYGDLVSLSVLTYADLQQGRFPRTIYLVVGLMLVAIVLEIISLVRSGRFADMPRAALIYLVLPLVAVVLAALAGRYSAMILNVLLTLALMLPIGPLLYRVIFQPARSTSVLSLLMIAVALHFALAGATLLLFGSEGYRMESYFDLSIATPYIEIGGQAILVLVGCALCSLVLYAYFEFTLQGKALRATALNRVGAEIVGIRTRDSGSIAFLIATGLAVITGFLIAPNLTFYHDTGFLIGLKGFVGSVLGGFVSYPLAALGGFLIGNIESFSAYFWSPYKEFIVFIAIIPVIILRYVLSTDRPSTESEGEHA